MPTVPDPLFAACPDRRGTGSEKWDRYAGRDVLPMWVADMDFQVPAEVLEAIGHRVDHGVFGYTHEPPGFATTVTAHLERRHGWLVDPARILATPGVVTGLALTARLLSAPEDEILTFTPVYPPFLSAPENAGVGLRKVDLVEKNGVWNVDFQALEDAVTPRTKLFIFCIKQM